jgi:BON domain
MDRFYDRERFGQDDYQERWRREPQRRFDYERGRAGRQEYGDYGGGEYGRGEYGRGRDYRYGSAREGEERGFFERAGDEVRSWFGDEDAERRRMRDEREYGGGSRWGSGEPSWRQRREQTWREQGHYGGYDRPSYRPDVQDYQLGWTDWTQSTPRGHHTAGDWRDEGWGYGEDVQQLRGSPPGGGGGYPPQFETSRPLMGQHVGRGPKGYQRSDERIKEDVCERLTQHGEVDASDIDITVSNGEVTLQGSVANRWAKRMAEDVAENVSGVREIHNRLRVSQAGTPGQQPAEGESWAQRRGKAA